MEVDIDKELSKTLGNGITMEIPYKGLTEPKFFWMFIFRNIGVGINKSDIVLDTNAAGVVHSKVVNVVNNFVNKAGFVTRGLLEDGEVAPDAVYEAWFTKLRWFITVQNKEKGKVVFSLGCMEHNPWDGLRVSEVMTFEAFFALNIEDKKYEFNPCETGKFQEVVNNKPSGAIYIPILVKAIALWSHGVSENGQVPSPVTLDTIQEKSRNHDEEVCAAFDFPYTSNASSIFKDTTHTKVLKHVLAANNWEGGSGVWGVASIMTKAIPIPIPIIFGDEGGRLRVAYNILTMLILEGSFRFAVPIETRVFNVGSEDFWIWKAGVKGAKPFTIKGGEDETSLNT